MCKINFIRKKMQVKEIKNQLDVVDSFDLLTKFYPDLNAKIFLKQIDKILKNGSKIAVAINDRSSCVGFVVLRFTNKVFYDKLCEIEDFFISDDNQTCQQLLLDWVEQQSKNFGSKIITKSILTKDQQSQKTFAREGFILDGFLFKKDVK